MMLHLRRVAALFFSLTVFLTRTGDCKRLNSVVGPYIAYGERFFMCDSTEKWKAYLRISHFNPYKPQEKQRLTGNLSGLIDGDDTAKIEVRMASRSNNQWKDNAYVFKFPSAACSAWRTHMPDVWRVVFKQDPAATTPCKVPAKLYILDDEPVDWYFPYVPVMHYGYYRFKLSGWQENTEKPSFCFIVEGHTIPK